MPTLEILPSELYARENWDKPRNGDLRAWKAYRSSEPLALPPAKKRKKQLVEKPTRNRPTKITPAFVDQVRRLAKRGSDVATATALNCSPVTIHSVRRQFNIPPFQRGRVPGAAVVPTPEWVPLEFINGFRERVKTHGQFTAAKWVRNRLKGPEARKLGAKWERPRDATGKFVKPRELLSPEEK